MEKHLHTLFYKLEDHHWWSVGIRNIQLHFVNKYLPRSNPKILDIGCGPGATLKELSKLGTAIGVDSSKYVLKLARNKGVKNVLYGNATRLPFQAQTFHCVTVFDVIEHIKNDTQALKEILRVLKPLGIAVFTSPAFMWLYDDHDRMNHHFRRYTLKEFRRKAEVVGFTVRYVSYCDTFLFPLIVSVKYFYRLLGKKGKFNNQETPEPLNSILKFILSAEVYLLDWVCFPFGLSILVVLEKSVSEG